MAYFQLALAKNSSHSGTCADPLLIPQAPCVCLLTLVAFSLVALLALQITLHAARDLTAGEELYAMYGEEYALHRDYEVGEPARSLPKSAIQFECRPAQSRMAHVCKLRGPTCAVLVV